MLSAYPSYYSGPDVCRDEILYFVYARVHPERAHPESDLQMTQLVMELGCTTAVVEYMSTVLHSRRVAVATLVADRYYMEDTSDRCSS